MKCEGGRRLKWHRRIHVRNMASQSATQLTIRYSTTYYYSVVAEGTNFDAAWYGIERQLEKRRLVTEVRVASNSWTAATTMTTT